MLGGPNAALEHMSHVVPGRPATRLGQPVPLSVRLAHLTGLAVELWVRMGLAPGSTQAPLSLLTVPLRLVVGGLVAAPFHRAMLLLLTLTLGQATEPLLPPES